MYIRFETADLDRLTGKRLGLLSVAWWHVKHGEMAEQDRAGVKELLDWFSDRLGEPDKFSCSSKPRAFCDGISWFKDTAEAHIRKGFELAHALRDYADVEVVRSENPGYVLFEDDFQVVVQAFREEPAKAARKKRKGPR